VAETGRNKPRVFDVLAGEGERVRDTPFGTVGLLHSGAGVRAEWVSKRGEPLDPAWFSQDTVDLMCIIDGRLRVEFEREDTPSRTLERGQVLILPPGVRCRACSWPREASEGAVFVAFYPAHEEPVRTASR
jgi:hypothetical protein